MNPNRLDDLSGLGHLCAAGVVFLTLVALNRALRRDGFFGPSRPEPALTDALDLVALATVADVVPLTGLNRAFVNQGLTVMRHRGRTGLAALLDAASLSEAPEAWHLGYVLGHASMPGDASAIPPSVPVCSPRRAKRKPRASRPSSIT